VAAPGTSSSRGSCLLGSRFLCRRGSRIRGSLRLQLAFSPARRSWTLFFEFRKPSGQVHRPVAQPLALCIIPDGWSSAPTPRADGPLADLVAQRVKAPLRLLVLVGDFLWV
jgi:hypothetical protein